MNGVEILATEEVATAFTFNWMYFWIMMGVAIGIFVLDGIIISVADGELMSLVITLCFGIVSGLLFGGIVGWGKQIPTEYETQYKVTISDEVPMNEFLERYEIIEQEGKIYTVRERK